LCSSCQIYITPTLEISYSQVQFLLIQLQNYTNQSDEKRNIISFKKRNTMDNTREEMHTSNYFFPSFSCTVHFINSVHFVVAWITQSTYKINLQQSTNASSGYQAKIRAQQNIQMNWRNGSQQGTRKLHKVFIWNSQLVYCVIIYYWVLVTCNDPSFCSFKLRLVNRSLEYCLEAFLQSVPAFIIATNSSKLILPSYILWNRDVD
jgi:hypothetical protein